MNEIYYIARNRDGSVFIFNCEPVKNSNGMWEISPNFPLGNLQQSLIRSGNNTSIDAINSLTENDTPLKLTINDSKDTVESYFVAADEDGRVYLYEDEPIVDSVSRIVCRMCRWTSYSGGSLELRDVYDYKGRVSTLNSVFGNLHFNDGLLKLNLVNDLSHVDVKKSIKAGLDSIPDREVNPFSKIFN